MSQFDPVELNMKEKYDSRAALLQSKISDTCFGYVYAYRRASHLTLTFHGDYAVIRGESDGAPHYGCPIGDMHAAPALREVLQWMMDTHRRTENAPFRLFYLTREQMEAVEAALPGRFAWKLVDEGDFIYQTEAFRGYAGKKLHGKRNHLNRFLRLYGEPELRPIEKGEIDVCRALNDRWLAENETINRSMQIEHDALQELLEHFDALGQRGLVVYVGGEPVAFTFGEPSCPGSDTFLVHAEKGLYTYDGIYPATASFLCRAIQEPYVNREDAAGDEGLRLSKRSYRPLRMAEKYTGIPVEEK